MNIEVFRPLLRWLTAIGIRTFDQFARWKKQVTDGTVIDILNKAHGCYIHGITFNEMEE